MQIPPPGDLAGGQRRHFPAAGVSCCMIVRKYAIAGPGGIAPTRVGIYAPLYFFRVARPPRIWRSRFNRNMLMLAKNPLCNKPTQVIDAKSGVLQQLTAVRILSAHNLKKVVKRIGAFLCQPELAQTEEMSSNGSIQIIAIIRMNGCYLA